ncbi:response regulator [Pseudoruegeria sp. HB172150]|uniref:response regulator n=1 Tax=Pseudoruegeria sp. HB172150 TaxID=2721164 RepID=UPI0020A62B73|nr:response regulator [Pseudoruegeria sp. HB172150]
MTEDKEANCNADLSDMNRILLVDDEDSIREPLAAYLTANGYQVEQAADATEARSTLDRQACDLVVLDIMMPGEDGLSLCRSIRETHKVPTILLSARGEEVERIIGLEIGADDYVTKPFNPRELMARIRAVLRRSLEKAGAGWTEERGNELSFGGWVLKLNEQVLMDREGVAVALSTGEFTLMHTLLLRPRTILSREQLLDETRGRSADVFDRSIDNMISRLRQKIEEDPKNPQIIKTVWGAGYMLAEDVRGQ